MKNNILTPIKWTGCKRTQADRIIEQMPDNITSYCELFLGSGAVMIKLLNDYPEKLSNCKHVICSDTNADLIMMWKLIKDNPNKLIDFYTKEWKERNTYLGKLQPENNEGEMVNHRNAHYYALRDKYNTHYLKGTEDGAMELMTLLAFNFNGLVRYGKKGFNAACMPVVPGIHPDNKKEIIMRCNELVKKYNVQFNNVSYDSLYIPMNSTIYLDPPYKMFLNENASGIYNSDEFNLKKFYNWCNETSKDCNMLVSFDGGTAGDEGFPECNGWTKITNDTGTSKFRRQMSKTKEPNKTLKTKESLYVKLLN